jgi:hypothetical protein
VRQRLELMPQALSHAEPTAVSGADRFERLSIRTDQRNGERDRLRSTTRILVQTAVSAPSNSETVGSQIIDNAGLKGDWSHLWQNLIRSTLAAHVTE